MNLLSPDQLRRRYLVALGLLPLAACGTASTECFSVEDVDAACPTEAEAAESLLGDHCGYTVHAVTGPGTARLGDSPWDTAGAVNPECCYPVLASEDVLSTCVVGRPYIDEGGMKTAPAAIRSGWARGRRPELDGLDVHTRAVLAQAWTEDALVEHASVAAFARTTLELMAVGAPADLVAAVQAAAADEVRHARLSFALAERYAGHPVAPGAFPLGAAVALETDLARLAAGTFREGCVGETVVALLSARAAARATDPAARALLEVVAHDEARHAELAWRTLGWLVRRGGAAARAAVELEVAALLEYGVRLTQVTEGADDALLQAHGRIRHADADTARRRAVEEVVLPCVRALLGAAATGDALGAAARPA